MTEMRTALLLAAVGASPQPAATAPPRGASPARSATAAKSTNPNRLPNFRFMVYSLVWKAPRGPAAVTSAVDPPLEGLVAAGGWGITGEFGGYFSSSSPSQSRTTA